MAIAGTRLAAARPTPGIAIQLQGQGNITRNTATAADRLGDDRMCAFPNSGDDAAWQQVDCYATAIASAAVAPTQRHTGKVVGRPGATKAPAATYGLGNHAV